MYHRIESDIYPSLSLTSQLISPLLFSLLLSSSLSPLLFTSLALLLQDLDKTLAIQDAKLKALELSKVAEGMLNDRQRAAADAQKKKLEAK